MDSLDRSTKPNSCNKYVGKLVQSVEFRYLAVRVSKFAFKCAWVSRIIKDSLPVAAAVQVSISLVICFLLGGIRSCLAANELVMHAFTGGADGAFPFAGLILDDAGNLYGTAWGGGAFGNGCESLGCGTVFRISPSGSLTILHAFLGGADGGNPAGALLRDRSGNLYGTTERGGLHGYGTVFRIGPNGRESVLYSFLGGRDDGADPRGALIADAAGNLYGTTNSGGASAAGVIFKLTLNNAGQTVIETVIHAFGSKQDGAYPGYGALIRDIDGSFYGTTSGGGAHNKGTIFKLSTNGSEKVLYSFAGSDGGLPLSGLIFDKHWNLYGSTFLPGTVFKFSPQGKLNTIHNQNGNPADMFFQSTLIMDSADSLFGTAASGGAANGGSVFKISRSKNGAFIFSTLYSFEDFSQPIAAVTFGKGDRLFGTTLTGGLLRKGTIFLIK